MTKLSATPPAIAVIQRRKWSDRVRASLTFVVALIAGAGTAIFQGELTGRRFVESALLILVAGISTYHGFWKPTGVAPTIEEVTSPSG